MAKSLGISRSTVHDYLSRA
ncbi:MAG: hypothetical protein FJ130_07855 [Deltaproteobacteria bacterium]|nr:hypothetical protein [Deltaproteobacteria bacterium]